MVRKAYFTYKMLAFKRGSRQGLRSLARLQHAASSTHLRLTNAAVLSKPHASSTSSSYSTSSSFPGKVIQGSKNTGYFAVIAFGLGLFGFAIASYVGEVIEDWRTQTLFDDAFAKIKEHPKIQGLLGTPMQGFGDQGQKGTRLHRTVYKDANGDDSAIVMRFYVQGPTKRAGTVFLQQYKNAQGNWDYLLLEIDIPKVIGGGVNKVTLIDNRTVIEQKRPNRRGIFGRAIWNP